MDISIILTVVLIASVAAYLFLPARKHTDIDGNPIARSPEKRPPTSTSPEPKVAPYRWQKPKVSNQPRQPYTFRGKGALVTAPMMLEAGLYQLTCQSAVEQTITVTLQAEDGGAERSLARTSGLTKHRFSIEQPGSYRLDVVCDAPESTWAVLVKPL